MMPPLCLSSDRAFDVGATGLFNSLRSLNSLRAITCDQRAINGHRTGEAAAHLYRYIASDIKLLFNEKAVSWKHLANASHWLNA